MDKNPSCVFNQAAVAVTQDPELISPVASPVASKRWDEDLSGPQKAACSASLSHHCLLAGPGTGKTRVLTHRVAYLHQVHGVPLNRIVVLTFTRASAKELRDRLRSTFGEKYGLVRVSTLHSFALRQLLRNDSAPGAPDRVAIADDLDESEVILPDLKIRLGLKKVQDVRDLLTALAAGLSQIKEDADPHWEESRDLAPLVTALREHRRAYGYGLRLELVYLLYKALATKPNFDLEPFSHVLVDEYQDLTECELRVVRHLADRGGVLYAAGDDDQSIYGWREAKPEGIRRFERDFGPRSFLYLEECQRCDQEIIDFAMKVISQDLDRIGKSLHSVSSDRGEFDCCGYPGDVSEAQIVATPGALRAFGQSGEDLFNFLYRHASGDWGELDKEDQKENELSLREGFRLLSAYRLKSGEKIWVITEADRSVTTLLLPEEY